MLEAFHDVLHQKPHYRDRVTGYPAEAAICIVYEMLELCFRSKYDTEIAQNIARYALNTAFDIPSIKSVPRGVERLQSLIIPFTWSEISIFRYQKLYPSEFAPVEAICTEISSVLLGSLQQLYEELEKNDEFENIF
jgi:hypothetical protein